MKNTVRVSGDKIRVGDIMRFRMSKYEPVRWLKVLSVHPGKYVFGVSLEGGCWCTVSIRNKCDWATITAKKGENNETLN